MTGGEGCSGLAFFFLSVFAAADFFAGKRLAAGFLVKGFGFDFAAETDLASWGTAREDFTALVCGGAPVAVCDPGDARLERGCNFTDDSVCG